MENIERASMKLTVEACKKFSKYMINYLKSTWMSKDPNTWNVFMVRTRTNNNAEAYNSVIGSKLKPHPNPYTLISVIIDELGNLEIYELSLVTYTILVI